MKTLPCTSLLLRRSPLDAIQASDVGATIVTNVPIVRDLHFDDLYQHSEAALTISSATGGLCLACWLHVCEPSKYPNQ